MSPDTPGSWRIPGAAVDAAGMHTPACRCPVCFRLTAAVKDFLGRQQAVLDKATGKISAPDLAAPLPGPSGLAPAGPHAAVPDAAQGDRDVRLPATLADPAAQASQGEEQQLEFAYDQLEDDVKPTLPISPASRKVLSLMTPTLKARISIINNALKMRPRYSPLPEDRGTTLQPPPHLQAAEELRPNDQHILGRASREGAGIPPPVP